MKTRPTHPTPWSDRARAVTLAMVIVAASQLLSWLLRGVHPFGDHSLNTNDLWDQLIPFHAQLKNVLWGNGASDWQYNWNTGLGVPWIPDYGTYVSSPVAAIVTLFPTDHLDIGILLTSTLTMMIAAALMCWYLHEIQPSGQWWLLGSLGAAYGMCGWALLDASYLPMWLSGLAGLPALGLVSEWSRRNVHWTLSVLVVAVVWWSNYYTAYMATIAAVILFSLRLIVERLTLAEGLRALVRFGIRGVLGVGLTAVLMFPVYRSIQVGAPGADRPLVLPTQGFLARLLPGTEGLGATPGLSILVVVLVFAFAFPFSRRIPVRERVVYGIGTVLVLASMVFQPTALAWHAFAVPNGNVYREAFVGSGLLVLLAWKAISYGEVGRRPKLPVLAGLGLVLLLLVWAHFSPDVLSSATYLSVAGAVLVVGVWGLAPLDLLEAHGKKVPVLLIILFTLEGGLATAKSLDLRDEFLAPRDPLTSVIGEVPQSSSDPAHWPEYRELFTAGVGPAHQHNFGAVADAPGISYYSSTLSRQVSEGYRSVGGAWTFYGRAILNPSEPVLRALLGVETEMVRDENGMISPVSAPAVPLIRAVPNSSQSAAAAYQNSYAARDVLLGAPLHEVPSMSIVDGDRQPLDVGGIEVPQFTVSGTCRPGSLLYMEQILGIYKAGRPGETPRAFTSAGPSQRSSAGTVLLGTVPESGEFDVEFSEVTVAHLRPGTFACLNLDEFHEAVEVARGGAPQTSTIDGSHISASWDAPITGDIIISTATTTGWSCRGDGSPIAVGQRGGFMALEATNVTDIECSFRTPWLPRGAALSFVALSATLGVAFLRRHTSPHLTGRASVPQPRAAHRSASSGTSSGRHTSRR